MAVTFVGSERGPYPPTGPSGSQVVVPLPGAAITGDTIVCWYTATRSTLWSLQTPDVSCITTLDPPPPVTVTGFGSAFNFMPFPQQTRCGCIVATVPASVPASITMQSTYFGGGPGPASLQCGMTVWRGVEQAFLHKQNGGPALWAIIAPPVTFPLVCDELAVCGLFSRQPGGSCGWGTVSSWLLFDEPNQYSPPMIVEGGSGSDTSDGITWAVTVSVDCAPDTREGYYGSMVLGLSSEVPVDPPDPPPDPEYGLPDQPPVPPANPLGDLLAPASIATGPEGTDLIVPAYPYRVTKDLG